MQGKDNREMGRKQLYEENYRRIIIPFFVCSISFIQLLRNTAEVLTVSDFLRARGDSLKTDKMMMKV